MSKQIAFLFPGQGAQVPGMGKDFYDHFAEARAVFDEADAILGHAFSKLIFEGEGAELTLTKNSQLAIFITSIAILRVVEEKTPTLNPSICAGLSLGEYTALVAAGKLSFADALRIVAARGEFMQEACETHPGTMQVVLGLELEAVQETVALLDGVWIANLNCPGQIVIAGTKEGIALAAVALKEKGARRVMPLDVSGAFHSGLMIGAQEKLAPMIHAATLDASSIRVVLNASGSFVTEIEEIRDHMIRQVTSPVYWQKGIEAMVEEGVELFIEMGPGKTLAGMNKRIGVSAVTRSVEKIEDLEGVVAHAPVA